MDGGLQRLCTLLQAAAFEYGAADVAVEGSGKNLASLQQMFCLSASVLSDLHSFFHCLDAGSHEVTGLWRELAEKNVLTADIVRILTGSMDNGGIVGIKAAGVYLCLLLTPECPVFSLFNQMAFDSLARCLRNCCKPRSRSSGAQDGVVVDRRKGQKKGKRLREREARTAGDNEHGFDEGQPGSSTDEMEVVSSEDIISLLVKLQKTILVLPLKERQETLKLIVELVVDMLHLLSDMTADKSSEIDDGSRGKKRAGVTSPKLAFHDIVFSTLESLLGDTHGDQVTTAIVVLRSLTPSILLSHAGNSSKLGIHNKTMQFVTRTLLKSEFAPIRPAVVAFPRYLCFKAPEKLDGRNLAVECVISMLKVSNSKEWCKFADFVCKFSRSKPRHRLVAVDVSLALLGGLPDPLRSEELSSGDEMVAPQNCREGVEDQFGIDEDSDAEGEGNKVLKDTPRKNAQRPIDESSPDSQWWSITCFEILLHRCSDKVPGIRARSLTNLAQAIQALSLNVSSRRHLQGLFGFNGSISNGASKSNARVPDAHIFSSFDTPIFGGQTPSPDPSSHLPSATPLTPGAGHRDLWSLLLRRCLDEKAAVRKSTLFLMKTSTVLLGKAPEDAILQAMGAACGDALISIRKAALAALSEVMRKFPGDIKVAREWFKSALPLAFDNEQALQDECLSLFEELVLDRITLISTLKFPRGKFHSCSSNGETPGYQENPREDLESMLPVGTLGLLREMADGSSNSSCVKRICLSLGKKKRLRPGVALALQTLISAQRSPDGAWFLLSEVTAFVPKAVGWEFLRTHWELLDDGPDSRSSSKNQQGQSEISDRDKPHGASATWAVNRVHLLQTISNVAVELPPDAAADLATELLDRLKAFNMHPAEVGAHIKALAMLCKRKALATGGNQLVIVWVKELLEQARNILQAYLFPSVSATHDDGAAAVAHTPQMRNGTINTSQNSQAEGAHLPGKNKEPFSQMVTVLFTVGELALVCPQVRSGHVITLLQALLTPARKLFDHRKGYEADKFLLKEKITPDLNVHVWLALGKLCLADDALAKRFIPLFVQELGRTDSAAVRNNITIVMTDFCVRYTALIDEYIHDLTRSLRDPCELVRRQAFVLLSRLLQRDYVKWRGLLFHRFLLALVDDSDKISQLAKFVFGSILKLKAPLLAYNSFVEAIFVLNDCCSQASSSAILQIPEDERSLFSLRGEAEVEKRMKIYTILLQQMVPEHLLATSAKLCAEILATAADGLLIIDDGPSQCVLKDALRILASKELRITAARGCPGNSEFEEEDGGTAATVAAVKGRVVTQLMKKNLVQNAVPILIELKRLLESRNSPLIGLLMECMRVMLKDYKNEIEEILVADKQLQKEILYDIQKHEAATARAKVAAAAAAIPIHREVLQGLAVTPGSARTPVSVNTPASTQQPNKSAQDNILHDNADARRAQRTSGKGKEILSPDLSCNALPHLQALKGASHHNETMRTPAFTSLRKSAVGNFVCGDGRSGPSLRMTWEQKTPRRIYSAMPGTISRSQASGSHHTPYTPHPHTSQYHPATPRKPMDPGDHPLCESTCLAGAVSDVAAAATAATVLQQVAQNVVTPFRAMSLPRLHQSVSMVSARGKEPSIVIQSKALQDHRSSLPSDCLLGVDNDLETVRRRQSFSGVEGPCGLPSQIGA